MYVTYGDTTYLIANDDEFNHLANSLGIGVAQLNEKGVVSEKPPEGIWPETVFVRVGDQYKMIGEWTADDLQYRTMELRDAHRPKTKKITVKQLQTSEPGTRSIPVETAADKTVDQMLDEGTITEEELLEYFGDPGKLYRGTDVAKALRSSADALDEQVGDRPVGINEVLMATQAQIEHDAPEVK